MMLTNCRALALARGCMLIELDLPEHIDSAPMPSAQADRLAEAIRRAMPELIKLDRYERRAAALRDRALQVITKSCAGL
jgi:hypothetical protein